MRRLVLPALVGLLIALAAAPAAGARRSVPYGFFGMNANRTLSQTSEGAQERAWASMASSGVEAARVQFSWPDMQAQEAGPIDFASSDAIVSRAARRRIRLLAVIYDAPVWARLNRDRFQSPPRDNQQFASFARQLVERYGPRGSFWREHPEVPRRPVVEWQVWNEPHLGFYWNVPKNSPAAWPRGYVRLLKASAQAIRGSDPKATVVLGGLTNRSWDRLRQLYKLHARRYFDAVGVQTWTSSPRSMLKAFRLVRSVMTRYHDRRKPIWATELGWPAARARVAHMRPDERSFTTTDRKMAKRLSTMYAYFVDRRRSPRYGVTRVYWYSWATTYQGQDIFSYSGLLRLDPGRGLFSARPALRYYRASARRFEGCSKTSTGICKHR
jgi:polysaccharide biosynthesis protein PslG